VPTRTRIVATLGPATTSDDAIGALIDAGVDVFRFNFSHGTHDEHGARIAAVRRRAGDRPVALLADLCGPKLRLKRPLQGKAGEIVDIDLPATVKPGEPVLLADGVMHLEVVGPNRARVVTPGDLPAGKGINLPSSHLDIPSLTEKDRADLAYAVSQRVDFVALSFVRRASDLDEVKRAGVPVVAKIEKPQALDDLDAIVRASDAVMVARGDLGVEIPIERVPVVQKRIIALSNALGRPVITATQMLRSMVDSPMPTRAEATDVANAVLDGTDAVMLSEETTVGRFPVETVRVMDRILTEIEPLLAPRRLVPDGPDETIAYLACETAERVGAKAIVVPTSGGTTARRVARWRPRMPILALAQTEEVRRRLQLVWGVTALRAPWAGHEERVLERFRDAIRGHVPPGATVVVTAGFPFATPGITNLVHVTTS